MLATAAIIVKPVYKMNYRLYGISVVVLKRDVVFIYFLCMLDSVYMKTPHSLPSILLCIIEKNILTVHR